MFKKTYRVPLRRNQRLRLVAIGDVHADTPEHDAHRFKRFIRWVQEREAQGEKVLIPGVGDYLDLASPSERLKLAGNFHDTTHLTIDKAHLESLREFLRVIRPIQHCFLGLLTGHHHYEFVTRTAAGDWAGRSSDAWLSKQIGCDYWGEGVALIRLALPHDLHLDCLIWHGSGGAQTPGGRVMKRIKTAEIAPTAHLVFTGHDNAKLAYPRSGLDYDRGTIKRYVIGTGSFQRAYLEGEEAGYAERMGLVPADLGVTVVDVGIEKRNGRWRVDYHASV